MISVFTRFDRFDPTRTTYLRAAFVAAFRKRFKALQSLINRAIVEKDCFGMVNVYSYDPLNKQFAFGTTDAKVEAFLKWLEQQEQSELLSIKSIPQIGKAINKRWTDKYVFDSYVRGILRARQEMNKVGYKVDNTSIEQTTAQPIHLDRLGVLYTRTYEELKGITSQMDTQISRVLTQGLIDGDGPRLIAKKLAATISGGGGDLGITDTLGRFIPALRRSEMLARTEIIRAHHLGMVQEMRNWGTEGVKVKAEWETAGHRVCPICAAREGKIYTLDEIEKMIPAHVDCRCCAIPVKVETHKKSKKASADAASGEAVAKKARKTREMVKAITRAVQDRILNKVQSQRYLEYKQAYTDWFAKELTDDDIDFFHNKCANKIYRLPEEERKREFEIRKKLEDKIMEEYKDVWLILKTWQGDTWEFAPSMMKMCASYAENAGEMIYPETKAKAYGNDAIMRRISSFADNRAELEDGYIRIRAFNQAYMDRIKFKKITLHRGIDGDDGRAMAKRIVFGEEDTAKITNAPLVGFTSNMDTAKRFGVNHNGITFTADFEQEDIFVHKDLLSGITDNYREEEEYIIINTKHKIPKGELLLNPNLRKDDF